MQYVMLLWRGYSQFKWSQKNQWFVELPAEFSTTDGVVASCWSVGYLCHTEGKYLTRYMMDYSKGHFISFLLLQLIPQGLCSGKSFQLSLTSGFWRLYLFVIIEDLVVSNTKIDKFWLQIKKLDYNCLFFVEGFWFYLRKLYIVSLFITRIIGNILFFKGYK